MKWDLQRYLLFVTSDVQLLDGTATEGRLEVYVFGAWRAVCPNGFDNVDATVACGELGLGYVYIHLYSPLNMVDNAMCACQHITTTRRETTIKRFSHLQ